MRDGAIGSFWRRMMQRLRNIFKRKRRKKEETDKLDEAKKIKSLKNKRDNEIKEIMLNKHYFDMQNEKYKLNLDKDKSLIKKGRNKPNLGSFVKKEIITSADLKINNKISNLKSESRKKVIDVKNLNSKKGKHRNEVVKKSNSPTKSNISSIKEDILYQKKDKIYFKLYKLIDKLKNDVNYKEKDIEKVFKEYRKEHSIDKAIKRLNELEKDINELFTLYFNFRELNFERIDKLQDIMDEIKLINKENFEYFDNLDFYDKLVLLNIKLDRAKQYFEEEKIKKNNFINKSNNEQEKKMQVVVPDGSLEQTHENIESITIDNNMTNEIITSNLDDANKEKIDTKLEEFKENVEEIRERIQEQKEKINKIVNENKKITLNRGLFSSIMDKVKGSIFVISSIPIIAIGRNIPTLALGMFMINRGIKSMRKKINKRNGYKYIIEDYREEKLIQNFNSMQTVDYFLDKSLSEMSQFKNELNEIYEKDEKFTKYLEEIDNINNQLLIQKQKIQEYKNANSILLSNSKKQKILSKELSNESR